MKMIILLKVKILINMIQMQSLSNLLRNSHKDLKNRCNNKNKTLGLKKNNQKSSLKKIHLCHKYNKFIPKLRNKISNLRNTNKIILKFRNLLLNINLINNKKKMKNYIKVRLY